MEILAASSCKKFPITFNQRPTHDSEHWNSMIKHQARLKDDNRILTTFSRMQSLGVFPNLSTLPIILKACGNLNDVEMGKKIHASLINTSLINDVRVGTSLVDFYCKCGCLQEALNVFDDMLDRDIAAWNAMISGLVEFMEYEEALFYCFAMQREGWRPNSRTLLSLLEATKELMNLRIGKELHGYCLRNGIWDSSAHVVTALIGFYLRYDLKIAEHVFVSIESKNVVNCNAMINGYVDAEKNSEAIYLFVGMLMNGIQRDMVTILTVIQACRGYGCLKLGMQLHQISIKYGFHQDVYIVNTLVNMYNATGYLDSARILFESVATGDVALWNSMLFAYVERGMSNEAVIFFRTMQLQDIQIDERTVCIVVPLCVNLTDGLRQCLSLQAHAIKCGMEDVAAVRSAFLGLYAELNSLELASMIFNELTSPSVLSWNTLILLLARNGARDQALDLYIQMCYSHVQPNSHTIISILAACDHESFLRLGRSIHGYAIKLATGIDPPLHTALTDMYLNCKDELTAKVLFENFKEKDLISWNAMIASYANNKEAEKGMLLFHQLVFEMEPNAVTIINALALCMNLANLPEGRCIHAYAARRFFLFELSVSNALITMYARCGNLRYAENIFRHLPKRNVVSWNAMLGSYGIHGRGYDALIAFSKLLEEGFLPDKITFLSILSACSHSGLIEDGLQLYQSMKHDFNIIPDPVHYACVVDLLARGGRFEDAWEFVNSMPTAPDASAWRALLGACRVYSKTESAYAIFGKLIELEPTNAGNYVLLSNIFAAAGLWSEVGSLRKMMQEKGLSKPPGKSWISIRNKIHYFTSGDKSHPQCCRIYEKLESLLMCIRETGYVPDLTWVLHDEEDEKKIKRLSGHSEKLAIAFSLISIKGTGPIFVTKNLRICGDCHEFSKHVSRLMGREIVVRDGIRFHHFAHGLCSCKDYW